jgi:hypothetical protein
MDTNMVIGIVLVVIVGFFAFQWWSGASKRKGTATAKRTPAPTEPMIKSEPAPVKAQTVEEKYPEIAGQTEKELKAKEPVQRPVPATQQQAVTYAGEGPAQMQNNLRRPEQSFHQPAQQVPKMTVAEVNSGRAAPESSPQGGHQQPFSPDFAQNGSAIIGNSVFAYDGMEPNDFSSF